MRKFYSNPPEHNNNRVFVRGKWVSFDRSTINAHYHLQEIPLATKGYHQYLSGTINYDVIFHRL
ncbi:hypothetical protein, partial [Proteus mirabilis]|uniref:hypothetical protein n=1 Tax=Proteus mirabilis TaxID=584 RepID=UPI001C12F8FD